ncbi:polysaccharide lyase family protein [Paenibacillus caui]|uniref:polysaccharide lyase family protein n=1 Tax=Paenibacillus caui TaxID=2873927 RepID=UPI001CA91328|nr:polysaccharide lyase family protein [Paenibacillus caui]
MSNSNVMKSISFMLVLMLIASVLPGWRTASASAQDNGAAGAAAARVQQAQIAPEASPEEAVPEAPPEQLAPEAQAGRGPASSEAPLTLLWQVGTPDNSSAEFKDFNAGGAESVSVPVERDRLSSISKGMKADANGTMQISYTLHKVPEYGVQFSFKVMDASTAIPQVAVFSNGQMSGLIQVTGLNNGEAVLAQTWKQTYKLYIPKEQLKAGKNELQLTLDRGLYADPKAEGYDGDKHLWFEWDHFKLEALKAPAAEPIHGRYIHLGSTIVYKSFKYDDNTIRHLEPMAKWMGIAYSGNWMRTAFWSDTRPEWEPQGRNYLLALRDLNLQPMVGFLGGNWKKDPDLNQGIISEQLLSYYRSFVSRFGDLYQYVEVNNEPGLFGWSQKAVLAAAQMLADERKTNQQPDLKIVAPGWAYWPYNGTPDGWERDAEQRRPIEAIADITNGHSYGGTGVQPLPGASLYENLRVYSGQDEGFGKEMAMSEVGANDNHADNTKYGTYAFRFASAFDRELRGDIGYADHIMQHAAFFYDNTDFGLFDSRLDWNTHRFEDTKAVPANPNELGETRLKTYRRLAAAYATHGSPLVYEVINKTELTGKKAYFRGVDTSALGTSAVGASSDKILLNFVNFETEPVTMKVLVTMPEKGTYAGDRFGPGETYEAAHSTVKMKAKPYLMLEVSLSPGETVQYILDRYEDERPTVPDNVTAEAVSYNRIKLTWYPSADNDRVAAYRVYRSDRTEPLMTVPGILNFMNDDAVEPETTYTYRVEAVDDFGNTSELSQQAAATTPKIPVTPHTEGDPTKFEAEAAQLDELLKISANAKASGGKVVEQTHRGGLTILGYHSDEGGAYTLTVAYTSNDDAKKDIIVNGQKLSTISLPSTGSWTDRFTEKLYSVTLKRGYNNIYIKNAGNGANIDYFKLVPGAYVPVLDWYPAQHDNKAILYSGFELAPNGVSHISSTPGASAVLYFNGTGIRWRSDIRSDMGSADVYVDGVLKETVDIARAGLEGEDEKVFEATGLENGLHRIEVRVKEGKVMVHGFEFESYDSALPTPQADMTVTGVGWTIVGSDGQPVDRQTPQVGDALVFWAKVKNAGALPTPLNTSTGAGMITGGVFSVNGGVVSWSDTYNKVIEPGDEVTLTANGSAQGTPQWIVPVNGQFTVGFLVNDIKRYPEMSRDNNTLSTTLNVGGSSE